MRLFLLTVISLKSDSSFGLLRMHSSIHLWKNLIICAECNKSDVLYMYMQCLVLIWSSDFVPYDFMRFPDFVCKEGGVREAWQVFSAPWCPKLFLLHPLVPDNSVTGGRGTQHIGPPATNATIWCQGCSCFSSCQFNSSLNQFGGSPATCFSVTEKW